MIEKEGSERRKQTELRCDGLNGFLRDEHKGTRIADCIPEQQILIMLSSERMVRITFKE